MLALTTPLLLAFAASEALARQASGSSPQPASPPGPPADIPRRQGPRPRRRQGSDRTPFVMMCGRQAAAVHPDFSAAILRRVIPRRAIS